MRTAGSRLAPLLAAALLACGETAGPGLASPRIDYVDGALEPILVRGQAVVIEGLGFGATQGTGIVTFARTGGGEVTAPVATPADWSDLAIRTAVPDAAAAGAGALTVTTAAGRRLTATVHVLPHVVFDTAALAWTLLGSFPQAPVGVALAALEVPSGSGIATTLYAAGGAEQVIPELVPDSGVYVAHTQPGGLVGAWVRQRDAADFTSRALSFPRAFAAAAIATRYNSRFPGAALYVIGGVGSSGRAEASVLAADITADSVAARFTPLEPLPAPLAGAIAVVRRGRIYVIGGTDSIGRPQQDVLVGRIGLDGHIDGWYAQPPLPAPRAYGGGVVLDARAVAFGGLADSVPPGGGLDPAIPRLASSDTAAVSLISGFFTGEWAPETALLPEARSQFATLDLGDVVLLVGGMYAGAATNGAETIAAAVTGDSLGPFAGPVGMNSGNISSQGGGTLVGPTGLAWRDGDGSHHGLALGGIDLISTFRKAGVWGF